MKKIRQKNKNTSKLSASKQQSFLKAPKRYFGGELLRGRRKSIRPLTSSDSIHFVLRSSWAMGSDSFLVKRNRKQVDLIISQFAKRFGVKIYQRAINSNHIHLLLKITNRRLYRAFIKAVTGKIASHVMGGQSFKSFYDLRQRSGPDSIRNSVGGDGVTGRGGNGPALKNDLGFWQFRPFSRIVNWGQDFKICVQYLKQNVSESLGLTAYKARRNYYKAEIIGLDSTVSFWSG